MIMFDKIERRRSSHPKHTYNNISFISMTVLIILLAGNFQNVNGNEVNISNSDDIEKEGIELPKKSPQVHFDRNDPYIKIVNFTFFDKENNTTKEKSIIYDIRPVMLFSDPSEPEESTKNNDNNIIIDNDIEQYSGDTHQEENPVPLIETSHHHGEDSDNRNINDEEDKEDEEKLDNVTEEDTDYMGNSIPPSENIEIENMGDDLSNELEEQDSQVQDYSDADCKTETEVESTIEDTVTYKIEDQDFNNESKQDKPQIEDKPENDDAINALINKDQEIIPEEANIEEEDIVDTESDSELESVNDMKDNNIHDIEQTEEDFGSILTEELPEDEEDGETKLLEEYSADDSRNNDYKVSMTNSDSINSEVQKEVEEEFAETGDSMMYEVYDEVDGISQDLLTGDLQPGKGISGMDDTDIITEEYEDQESSTPAVFDTNPNSDFVTGLDAFTKFFEDVDAPDELDVGANGTSMQDVLLQQGQRIIWKKVVIGFNLVKKHLQLILTDGKEKMNIKYSQVKLKIHEKLLKHKSNSQEQSKSGGFDLVDSITKILRLNDDDEEVNEGLDQDIDISALFPSPLSFNNTSKNDVIPGNNNVSQVLKDFDVYVDETDDIESNKMPFPLPKLNNVSIASLKQQIKKLENFNVTLTKQKAAAFAIAVKNEAIHVYNTQILGRKHQFLLPIRKSMSAIKRLVEQNEMLSKIIQKINTLYDQYCRQYVILISEIVSEYVFMNDDDDYDGNSNENAAGMDGIESIQQRLKQHQDELLAKRGT